MTTLILASKSFSRRSLLEGAGLKFTAVDSGVDEAAIKTASLEKGRAPRDIAMELAEAKALAIDPPQDALVIASDQVLEFEERLYDKPETMDEARHRLIAMAGKVHFLRSGLVLAQGGDIVWRHAGTASLAMRDATEAEIDAYLDAAGDEILQTVGAYRLEGEGVRLFKQLEGDYFTILGLALLPLLAELRRREVLSW